MFQAGGGAVGDAGPVCSGAGRLLLWSVHVQLQSEPLVYPPHSLCSHAHTRCYTHWSESHTSTHSLLHALIRITHQHTLAVTRTDQNHTPAHTRCYTHWSESHTSTHSLLHALIRITHQHTLAVTRTDQNHTPAHTRCYTHWSESHTRCYTHWSESHTSTHSLLHALIRITHQHTLAVTRTDQNHTPAHTRCDTHWSESHTSTHSLLHALNQNHTPAHIRCYTHWSESHTSTHSLLHALIRITHQYTLAVTRTDQNHTSVHTRRCIQYRTALDRCVLGLGIRVIVPWLGPAAIAAHASAAVSLLFFMFEQWPCHIYWWIPGLLQVSVTVWLWAYCVCLAPPTHNAPHPCFFPWPTFPRQLWLCTAAPPSLSPSSSSRNGSAGPTGSFLPSAGNIIY